MLKAVRKFLPEKLEVRDWSQVSRYYEDLLSRDLHDLDSLRNWLCDRSELEAFLQEDLGWRYIRMSCDTENKELAEAYQFFVGEVQPKISPLSHRLDLMLMSAPALPMLGGRGYEILLRQVRKRVEIYREENIPLIAELQQEEQEYSVVTGAMTVEVQGRELTLQQAGNYLEGDNRALREEVYAKIAGRRLSDRVKLHELFDRLALKRGQVAKNAGFSDFRDYMFASLGRFDYTPEDCFRFHHSVSKHLVPVVGRMEERHRTEIGVDVLKPWDTAAVAPGHHPLKPFSSSAELMEKTIACFDGIDPFLGDAMRAMQEAGRLDLDSRKGKAPGGYNYPLYETGLPFIFMNSTNTLRDLVTMVHEGGHAVQSILDGDLALVDFKNIPSEVAELASMSMELISMEHWHHFFKDPTDLRRARRKQLEDVLKGLPWIACVDAYQHWLYTQPGHTHEERDSQWLELHRKFSGGVVDWSGSEEARSALWQKQLHIYEVPFYYIEYGFAQLGAIAMWRNYRKEPGVTIRKYLDALKLGYTASIGEIYSAAGISFDFSEAYVSELASFVLKEWESLLD